MPELTEKQLQLYDAAINLYVKLHRMVKVGLNVTDETPITNYLHPSPENREQYESLRSAVNEAEKLYHQLNAEVKRDAR